MSDLVVNPEDRFSRVASHIIFYTQVGEFVMEKKDIKNYETYPIWKIESGRMLHKYELFAEEARILHRAIPTVSQATQYEPHREKTGFLPRRKQRRRSASR